MTFSRVRYSDSTRVQTTHTRVGTAFPHVETIHTCIETEATRLDTVQARMVTAFPHIRNDLHTQKLE